MNNEALHGGHGTGLACYNLYTSACTITIEEVDAQRDSSMAPMLPSNLSKEFNGLVLEAVDEALSILGDEPVMCAFYYQLEKRAKIKRDEIPDKLEAFHKALTWLFYSGAFVLERRISKSLYLRLGLEFPANNGWTLADYVREARLKYESL